VVAGTSRVGRTLDADDGAGFCLWRFDHCRRLAPLPVPASNVTLGEKLDLAARLPEANPALGLAERDFLASATEPGRLPRAGAGWPTQPENSNCLPNADDAGVADDAP
jgi:hypothetical protein